MPTLLHPHAAAADRAFAAASDPRALRDIQAKWQAVVDPDECAESDQRFEMYADGTLVMSPHAKFTHMRRTTAVLELLGQQRSDGKAYPETEVQTPGGVFVLDVLWSSRERISVQGDDFKGAPELCVEVWSPSNRKAHLMKKREILFAHGAVEYWEVQLDGSVSFYDVDGAIRQSRLFPNFPSHVPLA